MVKLIRRIGNPSYPALLITQNEQRFYFTTIPVEDLFPYCFVSRRKEDPTQGFQRTLNEDRSDDIAKYLAVGDGSIPTNVVLSAQKDAEFTYTSVTKSINFKRIATAFMVLDGQHRLWGYQKCKVRHRVPVAIYSGLSRAKEAQLFIDINTNQRGVSASLLLDIKQVAQTETGREQTLRGLFDRLSAAADSPLMGRLSASQSQSGKISRVTFNRSVGLALSSGILQDVSPDDQYKAILNYLKALERELEDVRILVRSAYFEAIFEVFDEVVRLAISQHENAKLESLQKVIKPIAKINFESHAGGFPNKKGIASAMQVALRKSSPLSPSML